MAPSKEKASLSQQLAELLTPAPVVGNEDPEDYHGFGTEARAVLDEEEDLFEEEGERERGKERGIGGASVREMRLRGLDRGLEMEGEDYAGKKSSRKALEGGSWDGESDSDDDDDGAEGENDDGDTRDAGIWENRGLMDGGDVDEVAAEADDKVEELTHTDRRQRGHVSKSKAMSASGGSDSGGEGSDGEEEEAGGAALDRDFEMALIQELGADTHPSNQQNAVAGVEAGDGDMSSLLQTLQSERASEREKGKAVAAQRAVWERLLEVRISLQRPLALGNRLPCDIAHTAFVSRDEAIAGKFAAVREVVRSSLGSAADLADALQKSHPAVEAAFKASEGGEGGAANRDAAADAAEGVDGREGERSKEESKEESVDDVWRRVDESYARFRPFALAAVDRCGGGVRARVRACMHGARR